MFSLIFNSASSAGNRPLLAIPGINGYFSRTYPAASVADSGEILTEKLITN